MENTTINNILCQMRGITLEQMRDIHLMDRIDSKFVAPAVLLPDLLNEIAPYFMVQVNNDKVIAPYTTQYLDTENLDMFLIHQNGKLNRQKIRIRSYVDSNVSFLEVKNKNNKGRTSKIRVPIQLSHINSIDDLIEEKEFLNENSLYSRESLMPSLANNFHRITLVNNKKTERVTIDINLSFQNYNTGKKYTLDDLMILELKQDGWQQSDFREALTAFRIKQLPFSKYCMGTVYTAPHIKHNRFKTRLVRLHKLKN